MRAARRVLLLLLTLGLAAAGARAQALNLKGSDIRVNRQIAGTQWLPDVATGADGRFVVVWKEGGDTTDATKPVFMRARIFDASGKPRSGDIQVARVKAGPFQWPAVAMAPDGRFVVVWTGGTENPRLVFGRRFAANGQPLGPRFRLAPKTADGQDSPDIAIAADGSFVTVWTQAVEGNAEINTDVFLRRFGADGRPLGPEVLAIGGFEEQSEPQIAMRPNGDFVIVCQTWRDPYDVLARLFSRSGAPGGEAFQVNDGPNTDSNQYEPAVAMAPDGRFAVAWSDAAGDFNKDPKFTTSEDYVGVGIRFYAADGTALGPGLSGNTFLAGRQEGPAVSALQNGGFLVLWTSLGQDSDGSGIFGRVYGTDAKPRGREFRFNVNRTGSQQYPAVAVAPNGKGAAAWTGPDGNGRGVFARRLEVPGQGN